MQMDTDLQNRIMAGDLLAAARSQQNCVRRLFYVYDRAKIMFDEKEGQANPESILVGLQAACTGLRVLTSWLTELGSLPWFDFRHEAHEMELFVEEWLSARGLALPAPNAL